MSLLPPSDDNSGRANQADRRAHPRRAVSPRLYVVLCGANSDGVLYDVSEGGAGLDILGSQPEGEYIVVDFEMAEIGRQFEAKARITWRDEAGKKVGLHFVDLPEESRNQLKNWLLRKMSLEDAAQSALLQDAAREPSTIASPPARLPLPEPGAETGNDTERDSPRGGDDRGDKLVQNLIASFNQREISQASPLKASFANLFASRKNTSFGWNSRRGITIIVAACAVAIVALSIVAYRSPARNAGINVSKAGQLPDTGPINEGEAPSAVSADSGTGRANGFDLPAPGVPPPVLPSASKNPTGQPCINLGSPSDKIRIYLWSEKDTPARITAAYATHLRAVQDVRMVNQSPYDLVLYVNGAAAGSNGPKPGLIWSSRVFRPWYCGQTLGLLEQTQVNESLHYVEGANLDRYIQSEVAYLILHTFETIRKEHSK